jgi:hypothetical protein
MRHLLKLKYAHSSVPSAYFYLQLRVPFRPTTVQMPNFELIETKQITVYIRSLHDKLRVPYLLILIPETYFNDTMLSKRGETIEACWKFAIFNKSIWPQSATVDES